MLKIVHTLTELISLQKNYISYEFFCQNAT